MSGVLATSPPISQNLIFGTHRLGERPSARMEAIPVGPIINRCRTKSPTADFTAFSLQIHHLRSFRTVSLPAISACGRRFPMTIECSSSTWKAVGKCNDFAGFCVKSRSKNRPKLPIFANARERHSAHVRGKKGCHPYREARNRVNRQKAPKCVI